MQIPSDSNNEAILLCQNIGQSFIIGASVGMPYYFYHGYRYAPKFNKFAAGIQLAKTRGLLQGTSFLVWRLIFEATNTVLKKYRGKDDFINWGVGGAFVGWVMTVRAGTKLGRVWAVSYSAVYQGQYFFNQTASVFKKQYQEQCLNSKKKMQDLKELGNSIGESYQKYQQKLTEFKQRSFSFLNNFKINFLDGLSSQ